MEQRSDDQAEQLPTTPATALTDDPTFDILEWYPAHQSCQRYFLDVAQHDPGTQALCALINIRLPSQWLDNPIHAYSLQTPTPANPVPITTYPPTRPGTLENSDRPGGLPLAAVSHVSLIPYLRRLVVTGFDKPAILHGFFGDDYLRGVMPHIECERRNYLFSAKAGGWRSCKKQYDGGSAGGGDETVPFMKPLAETRVEELNAADKAWSGWLAMEDWMVGPRAPDQPGSVRTRRPRDSGLGGGASQVSGLNGSDS